jgi:hypothetical protein
LHGNCHQEFAFLQGNKPLAEQCCGNFTLSESQPITHRLLLCPPVAIRALMNLLQAASTLAHPLCNE